MRAAQESQDAYVVAFGANVALKMKDSTAARALMDRLLSKQTERGFVDGAKTSIVGSSGESLQIETTSYAVLAWLQARQDSKYAAAVEKAVRFLAESCKGGRYGSTQSTVLALRAILAYDAVKSAARRGGSVQLLVDDKPVGDPVGFAADTQSAITLPSAAPLLGGGSHELELRVQGGAKLPYTVSVRYHALTPASSPASKLALVTTLRDARLTEGATTEIEVTVKNVSQEVVPMPVAIIGVPGGLEVRHDQLKELKKADRIAAYEVRGRDVVLYWRELGPQAVAQLPISLTAAVPGVYTAPASRAYPYYGDEHKVWAAGVKAEIAPR